MTDPRTPAANPAIAAAEEQPLVVPMRVEALMVNERVRQAEVFQRWQANYALTRLHLSPEPPPFSNTDLGFNADPDREGVYLHWQLPDALTAGIDESPDPGPERDTGKADEGEAGPEFPTVPNRWLVVRQAVATASGARTESGWIVESDHLDPEHGASPYLHPHDGSLTRIGRRVDLATGAWTEPGTPAGGMFLTAVGPGLATFAAYQPYNTDVFSIHDRLTDLDPTLEWRLNYLVAGWYSDPTSDPLAGDLGARMAALNWVASGTAPVSAARTLCHGTVLDVRWQRVGGMPASDRPDYVTVALGNTTAHATGALREHAAHRAGEPPEVAALLTALHAGVLDLLDEADGEFSAERALHTSWFTPTPAGYGWVLEEAAPQGDGAPAPRTTPRRPRATRAAHTAALARLNTDQAVHDTAMRDLAAAQRRLYDLWWAANLPKVPDAPGEPDGAYREDLNELVREATREAVARRDAVTTARADVPWGDTPQALDAAIRKYQTDHDLPPAEVVLKRAVLSDFQLPNDPVVVIRGTKDKPTPPTLLDGTDPYTVPGTRDEDEEDENPPLACRWPDRLITGVTVAARPVSATEAQTPKPPNLPAPDGISGALATLLRELFHLASSNAPRLAAVTGYPGQVQALADAMRDPHANAVGTPGAYTRQWRQPWSPLFFEWKVDYFPIQWHGDPDGTEPDRANWDFDGDRYHWRGTGAHPVPLTLRGRQFLTPTPGRTDAAALRQYARTHPGPAAGALRALARQADDGDLFSQQMVGFTEQLTARGHTPAVINPHHLLDPDLRTALAEAAGRVLPPNPGHRPHPFEGWNPSLHQPLRAGQFAFERLAVIDRFGHALPAIHPDPRALDFDDDEPGDVIAPGTPARRFAPELPEELTPTPKNPDRPEDGLHTIHPPTWYRFTQLTPRLLQPARAGFTLLDALDDHTPLTRTPDPDATAVGAWLVPAHLDQALHCYAPDGAPLGELRTTLPPDGTARVTWHALPYSRYPDQDDLRDDFPHLHAFLTELSAPARGPAAMRALLTVVDRTLSMTAPTGGTPPPATPSVLLGRPLALIRVRLQLDLDGPPPADPSWENLREAEPPSYPHYRWPIRLGERNELADGLVGYFHGARGATDYRLLHTVLDCEELPDEGRAYFAPIGTGAGLTLPARPPGSDPDDRETAFLTLLADPRGTVHATADILPTAEIKLPTRLVEPPLAALPVSFRLGPLPATAALEQARTGEVTALTVPRPSDRHGTWTWAQRDGDTWTTTPTDAADDRAEHPRATPTLRTGRLQLRPESADETEGSRR
ncbi:hypothetical protein [Embleya sp. NPDC001921]